MATTKDKAEQKSKKSAERPLIEEGEKVVRELPCKLTQAEVVTKADAPRKDVETVTITTPSGSVKLTSKQLEKAARDIIGDAPPPTGA